MKRFLIFLLAWVFVLTACETGKREERCAEDIMAAIFSEFPLSDGYIYSNARDAELVLSDAMLERLFAGARLEDLRYVKTMAVYLSARYSEGEIFIMELYDISHMHAVKSLLKKREEKKENAVLVTNGVYLYLIATEQNAEIVKFLTQ